MPEATSATTSAATSATSSAQCCCGEIKLHFTADPKSVIHCHCGQCRHLSGSAFTTWASYPGSAMSVSGQGFVAHFDATENVRRHFCSRCGTHVFTLDKRCQSIVGVPAGAIQGDLPVLPKAHYFVSHKAAWHVIADSLPQFGGESGFEPVADTR